MTFSAEESVQDRLARAAAALAEAEVVAGVRADGPSASLPEPSSVPTGVEVAGTSTQPDLDTSPVAARSGVGAVGGHGSGDRSGATSGTSFSTGAQSSNPRQGSPTTSRHGSRSDSRSDSAKGSKRSSRQGRKQGSKPGSGWASSDPGERPDWAPPPDDSADTIPDADAASVARAIALRQLSMAPRSRAQLERKLRQRGCDDDVAAKVLDRLTEVGLVDDEAYAQMLVRSKQSDKGLARRALAHELRKQGIDQDIADDALGQVGAGDERVRAEQLVAKKLRSMRGLAPEVQTRRLAGLLARKGYSGEVAWPVIRDAVDGLPEHLRD
ncbi:regulatory protein RecX [Terrabacter carboxydivorans]|uniref:Regulatory protein RecX n=1 Tax=Terrabacter carboxydivorans TaxID=619730 RepID=A0ABP5Y8X1_9MICO